MTDNRAVKAGQLIARLDDREYRTKVAEAEADLHLNQATADNLAATRIQQLSLIRQAEAKVSSANAEQVRAQQQVRRVSQLNERHYSSQDSLDAVSYTHLDVYKRQRLLLLIPDIVIVAQGVTKIPDGSAQILTGASQAFAAKHHDDDHEQDQQMPDMNATQSHRETPDC